MKIVRGTRYRVLIVALWVVAGLIAASHRSFWVDEFNRELQTRMGLFPAIRSVLSEPSPFAPGEIVLEFFSRSLFSSQLSPELWGRLPGIAWGAATLALALALEVPFLWLLVAFSAPLFTLAVELRPYGSLFFAGAVAFALLLRQKRESSLWLACASWLTVAFAHIYGVCFVGLASALRRQWTRAAVSFAYVAILVINYRVHASGHPSSTSLSSYGILEVTRQTLGILGNPHKGSLVLLPFAAFGAVTLFRRDRRLTLELGLLACAAIVAPIAATVASGYFFVPRQVVGGAFTFLAMAGLGLDEAIARLEARVGRLARLVWVPALAASVVPFVLTVVLAKPPFPNQPFHRYRELANGAAADYRLHDILLLDACNIDAFVGYLSIALRNSPSDEAEMRDGLRIRRLCWERLIGPLCLIAPTDGRYCACGSDEYGAATPVGKLLHSAQPPFGLVLYNTERLPDYEGHAERTW